MREKITASEGMIYTNGEVYGKTIYLAEGVSEYTFWEITEQEYEKIVEAQNQNKYDILL
jgi:hypothetical protein